MSDEVFSLTGVSYAYPSGAVGLDSVSLGIRRGERIVLLGANASGKSTLLQLLDGLIFPASGEVTAFGQMVSEESVDRTTFGRFLRREVAFSFQNVDAQLFCSTVEEELAFGPRHNGMTEPEIRERAEDLLGMFSLRGIRHRSPHTLSGGEKRRVGLAAILAVNPSVVLLDEPTSGLDPRNRSYLIDILDDLATAGKTLLVATHDLDLADQIGGRALVLSEDHRIAAEGETRDILADESLLAGVNLLHVHPHRHGGTLHTHRHAHSGAHEHTH